MFVFLSVYQSLCNNLITGDVFIVTFVCLGSWCENGGRKLLIFFHSFGDINSTNRARTLLVFSPRTSGEVSPHNHLNPVWFATNSCSNQRMWSSLFPIWNNISSSIQKLCCNLIQYLPFVRNALRKHHIKGRYSVRSNHYQCIIVDGIYIAYFPLIYFCLSWELVVG